MKNTLILLASFFFASLICAQEMNFEIGTWKEIKAKAKAQNKLVFLDAFTSWCGPCKAMTKNTFTDSGVAAFYNSTFINAKIDMEKGEGPDIAKKYQVKCYPNLLFIDGDGNMVHRSASYLLPADFILLGKEAIDPEKTFSFFQKKYESGNTNPVFISQYLNLLSHSCLSANDAAVKYFSGVKEPEMVLPENWGILRDYVEDPQATPFGYLVKNRKEFAVKYTTDSVNDKIFNTYINKCYKLVYQKTMDDAAISKLKKEIELSGFERTEELQLLIDLACNDKAGKWDNYFNNCKALIEKYKKDDSSFLNNVSWNIFEKCTDKNQLAEAEAWAKKSVEIKEEAFNLDTYANLLFKNGKKLEAITTEKKAIELAKAGGFDSSDLESTLAKFEEKK